MIANNLIDTRGENKIFAEVRVRILGEIYTYLLNRRRQRLAQQREALNDKQPSAR